MSLKIKGLNNFFSRQKSSTSRKTGHHIIETLVIFTISPLFYELNAGIIMKMKFNAGKLV